MEWVGGRGESGAAELADPVVAESGTDLTLLTKLHPFDGLMLLLLFMLFILGVEQVGSLGAGWKNPTVSAVVAVKELFASSAACLYKDFVLGSIPLLVII